MLEKFDHVVIINNFKNSNNEFKSWDSFKKIASDTFYTYMKTRLVSIECLDWLENYKCYAIGLILNPEMLRTNIEKGPVYGSQEAVEFKNLWGDMSTVRQINGGVYECVIWPKDGNLTLKIVNFIMREKLGFPPHGTKGGWHQIYSEQFNKYINGIKYLTNKKSVTINEVFDKLSSILSTETASETIKKLPVHINELRPIGSWYKRTNIFPEKLITVNGFNRNAPIEQINNVFHVAFVVEANNKWPSDLDAFQLMKKLYMAKLSKFLWNDRKIISKVLKNGKLDIILNGFVFRCFLLIQKEFLILRRQEKEKDVKNEENNNTKKRKIKHISKVDDRLCNMSAPIKNYLLQHELILDISTRIRCFSAQYGENFIDTCRLVKRWLSCQYIDLISDDDERITATCLSADDSKTNSSNGWCFTEVAIELIVSHVFMHACNQDDSYPLSAICGFLRFLKFMSEFNWALKPLVINFNNELSVERINELAQPFSEKEHRFTQLPNMVIRTPVNVHGDHWTTVGPNIEMLTRVQELSKKAYYCAEHLLLSDSDYKPLFTVDISRFEVLFHLNDSIVNLYLDENIDATKGEIKNINDKNKKSTKDGNFQRWPINYDDNPVKEFVIWIRQLIEGDAVCSINKFGGKFIALEWLRNDVDKNFIIKSICCKGRNFISKCEILK